MTTDINIACPECQQEVMMTMAFDQDAASNELTEFLNDVMSVSSHYSFRGMAKCHCGKIVMSCLSVSAHEHSCIEKND